MPILRKLSITNLRNIGAAEFSLCPGFNLFCGVNGSGKTSILEGIHLLALGRSFRSHLQKPVIKDGETTTTIYGETSDAQALGVQRSLREPQLIHINGRRPDSLAELIRYLPLQLINSETFQILEGPPRERRQFLDWGVFHVEQAFFTYWRQAKIALSNRNKLLRAEASLAEIEPWSNELAKNALPIDAFRSTYAASLEQELRAVIKTLFDEEFSKKLKFRYLRGWNSDSELIDQLQRDITKDRKYGYTTAGPHKADLSFHFGNFSATDVLSRGQLKMLICALKIAQSRLLFKATGKHCVFIVDDLPAELDSINRGKVCRLLADLQDQIFITAIEEDSVLPHIQCNNQLELHHKVFHVKHGTISSIDSPSS